MRVLARLRVMPSLHVSALTSSLALFVLACSTPTAEIVEVPETAAAPAVVVEPGPPLASPPPRDQAPRYPNELPGYDFHADAAWAGLVPLESTLADVRRVLGEPSDASDLADYVAPYPGDAAAIQPVLTYDISEKWDLLVYLVRSDLSVNGEFPASVQDFLLSIDLVPDEDLRFEAEFSASWRSRQVAAADAGWTTWTDGSGLSYEVYGNGELSRVIYGPSDAQLTALGIDPASL